MGFKSAFLPYAIKRAMLADVVNELKAFKPASLENKKEQLCRAGRLRPGIGKPILRVRNS